MKLLQIAALLGFLLGLAHSVLGERYILMRLFRRDTLPKLFGGTQFTTRTLRFAWHLTTIALWGFAALLWQASSGGLDQAAMLRTIGWTCLASGLLPLFITRGKHLSWIVLFAIGTIALMKIGG
ncbi:MAG: hypothetical protein WBP11_13755 [Dokdonella sp.]